MVAAATHDLLPDRLQPLLRPPLGLLPKPRRARVAGVSSAHHEEVGGHLASSASSPGSSGPRPRGRCQQAPLCHKNVIGNIVHTKVTKVAVECLKARMISALVFLILKSHNKAECIGAINANKIVVVGVLLQDYASRSLRSCIYWAGKLTDC